MASHLDCFRSACCSSPLSAFDAGSTGQQHAAALTAAIWDRPASGPVNLNVVFLDGHPTVQDLVRQAVTAWEGCANIRFHFLGPERFADAHIRITMPPSRVFQSYLGCQSLMFDRRVPSMTLGFTDDVLASLAEVRRLVLHEFGHALGLIHEHQNPNGGLQFRIPEVYQYFWQTQHWDQQTVQEQIITPATMSELKNAVAFDPDSIMLYSFPASIIAAGPVTATKVNYDLSDGDKRYIASIYPSDATSTPVPVAPPSAGTLPLTLGEPVTGMVPIRGAEIPYSFEVGTPGTFTMETFTPPGSREEFWVLTLLDAAGTFLDNDQKGSSPHGLNALIRRALDPGRYVLKLRHRLRNGVGDYGVIVRPAS